MAINYDNLRIVILECPYDSWDYPPARELFARVVSLKLAGYRARHPYGVLPVDAYDFVATHDLVCEATGEGLRPLMGCKTISYERCLIHRIPFPMLALLDEAGFQAEPHKREVQAVLDRCAARRIPLSYSGSWTIDPKLHAEPERARAVHEVFEAMYLFGHLHRGFGEMICGTAPRMKTDQVVGEWGARRMSQGGELLPSVPVPHLQGMEMVVMHLTEFSQSLKARAERHRPLWEERTMIEIQSARILPFKKAA